MANTTLTQTGAQVQADLDKVESLANIKSIGTGLTLTSAGEIQVSGGASNYAEYSGQVQSSTGTLYYLHNGKWYEYTNSGSTSNVEASMFIYSGISTNINANSGAVKLIIAQQTLTILLPLANNFSISGGGGND